MPFLAKYQLICVGNAERMLTLTKSSAQTIKALSLDAFNRNCVLNSKQQKHGLPQKRLNPAMHDDRASKRPREVEQMDPTSSFLPSRSGIQPSADTENARVPSERKSEPHRSPASDSSTKLSASEKRSVALCSSSESSLSSSESSSSSDSSSDGPKGDESAEDESVTADSPLVGQQSVRSSTPPIPVQIKAEVIAIDNSSERSAPEQDDDGNGVGVAGRQMAAQPEVVAQHTGSPQFDCNVPTLKATDGRHSAVELGRSEMPLGLSSSLVMSYDSGSCGDNGSAMDSDADEEGNRLKTESRTNMTVGTNGFQTKTSIATDYYDIDI